MRYTRRRGGRIFEGIDSRCRYFQTGFIVQKKIGKISSHARFSIAAIMAGHSSGYNAGVLPEFKALISDRMF